jgi:hypothetical protein
MHLVSQAKSCCVAYTLQKNQSGAVGRPGKKGQKTKLITLFEDQAGGFQEGKAQLYRKTETVRYLCTDLLWGNGLYQLLRFFLVEIDGKPIDIGAHRRDDGSATSHRTIRFVM